MSPAGAESGDGERRVNALARRWAEALAEWAIPEAILQAAPESPWGFPVAIFVPAAQPSGGHPAPASADADAGETPSRRMARTTLQPDGGTVLDVGAGAGAASLALVPWASRVSAVDESADMLAAFADLATGRAVTHDTVQGRWPDVADRVVPADLVVCHHVLYNVADLVPFLLQLTGHARRRVVVELTDSHPMSDLNPLWRRLHGIDRPTRPTADDVVELLQALGTPVQAESFSRPSLWMADDHPERVAWARRRLCVGPDRDAEIARFLPSLPRRIVTLWWDV